MSARTGELVFMVTLLSSVLATSIKESGENLSEQAECRGACSLARDKTSKTGVKVLRALYCYHCLNRRKAKQWRPERIKDRLLFNATTSTKRHRRSLFLDASQSMSSTALKTSDCMAGTDNKSVPEIVVPSKVHVAFGKYENTSYWYVNVSWTPLNDSSGHLYATMLDVSINAMMPRGICAVLRMNQTFLNINISFYGYSYPESIGILIHGLPYRQKYTTPTSYEPRIPTSSTLTTLTSTTGIPASSLHKTAASDSGGSDSSSSSTSPTTTYGSSVSTATNKNSSTTTKVATIADVNRSFHPGVNHTVSYVSIAIGILLGLLLFLSFLKCMFVYIRRRKRNRVPVLEDFDYDAFIIYSSKDCDWVQNKLRIPLEEKYHLKCCIHFRDFDPGGVFLESMADSVDKSFKIIAVFSKNFQKSKYCKHELQLAAYRQVSQGDDCLVIIRIDDTKFSKLPKGLQRRSVIDYFKTVERPFWMSRLLQFLRVPEDSDNQDAVAEQERNTNNRRDSRTGRRKKHTFVRLSSTSSNESAVSFV